jgi:hypothetical protein
MMNSKKRTSVTKIEPRPLDKHDWLRIVTSNRQLHQQMATPRGRLQWLFAFGERRGEPPEDRDPHALACEIGLFVFMTGSGRLAPAAYYFVEDSHEELMKRETRELSFQVGKGIDNFVDAKMGAPWVIPVICPMTRTLSRVINQDRTDRTAVFDWWDANDLDDWATAFMLAAADMVAAEASNLRRCEGCSRIFVADDPRERFHDKPCATKYRVTQWRSRPARTKKEPAKAKTRRKTGDT